MALYSQATLGTYEVNSIDVRMAHSTLDYFKTKKDGNACIRDNCPDWACHVDVDGRKVTSRLG